MHCNYRGAQEWKDLGIPLTTGSDETCKLFDAAVTQVVGRYDDESLGGLEGTLKKMTQTDPDFLMGHVYRNWLNVGSGSKILHKNSELAEDLTRMMTLSETIPGVTTREKKHAQAINLWAHGNLDQSISVWEDILVEHPCDVCAISMLFITYINRGKSVEIRDCLAGVLPYWKPSTPLYSYILGYYAFGLEQSNMFSQAEKMARKALSINQRDPWSVHALCHVMESTGRPREAVEMMEKTESDWVFGGTSSFACHNYWHWALNLVNLGEYQSAVSILDDQLITRLSKSHDTFNLSDVSSLLYRLQFEGKPVEDRWDQVSEIAKEKIDDHINGFYDVHIFMACLNHKDNELADKMLELVQEYIREGKGDNRETLAMVGESMMKAFAAYKDGDFGTAVDIIHPIKYKIKEIGGSNAQRDVFNLFLIHAALRSPIKKHHQLARHLINGRKSLLSDSPMTDRLMARVMALHDD